MSLKIKKLLIANRGEIAYRIIRTCQRLGIETVTLASTADKNLPHAQLSDYTVLIGEGPANDSYLNISKIIEVAKKHQVDAVHPGYGFLSENAGFATTLAQEGICFIGPSAMAIEAMGSKNKAKAIARQVKVPIIQGYTGDNQDINYLLEQAHIIGFPLLIKATHGGGGKGMRVVAETKDFQSALEACQREAQNAFSNATVMLEKFIETPRHIEVQIFGDQQGEIIALSERDCSLQRRHQKIIEEAPALGLTPVLRQQLTDAAIAVAKAVQYVGAGTVEFLIDGQDHFYFLEMNTRLQVEHPVTEEILGIDLVEWQIRIAEGYPLPLSSPSIQPKGYAIEARLYAEDPDTGFLPSIGHLTTFNLPFKNCRVEAGYAQGNHISPYYDPMMAKLVVHAENRLAAIKKLEQALLQTRVIGVKTNQKFILQLLRHVTVRQDFPDVGFIDRTLQGDGFDVFMTLNDRLLAVLMVWWSQRQEGDLSPWGMKDDWRSVRVGKSLVRFQLKGHLITANCWKIDGKVVIEIEGQQTYCSDVAFQKAHLTAAIDGQLFKAQWITRSKGDFILTTSSGVFDVSLVDAVQHAEEAADDTSLQAPMSGRIISVFVQPGDEVEVGTPLLILEAMKMEHTIRVPFKGVVEKIFYTTGDFVDEGVELASVQGA